jgi:SAM-dependent methyltransferase
MSVATRPKARQEVRVDRPHQLVMPGFEIGPDDTVVDVGCGDGVCCRYAGSMGAAVIGIDVEPTLVERADEAMQGIPARSWRGIVDDCNPIPLPDATASVVICTEVLEHVEDPSAFAAELARIGKPGARYLISVPDPASEALMRTVAPSWYWRPPFHVRVFQHEQLDAVLAGAGLTIERRDPFGPYYSFRWLLWMNLGRHPYDQAEDDPLMRIWEGIWGTLMASRQAKMLARGLEQALPKSQIVLASKPGGPRTARLRRRWLSPAVWKRRLQSGSVRIGGAELTWDLHSARRDP